MFHRFLVIVAFLASSAWAYGEQITVLPQDQNRTYLTVFARPTDPVVKWFDTNSALVQIKGQHFYTVINPDSVMFRARYSRVTIAPCIRLQSANGKLLFQMSWPNMPANANALARVLIKATQDLPGIKNDKCIPGVPCPANPALRGNGGGCPDSNKCPLRRPKPQPTPEPQPQPDPEPQPVTPPPDTTPVPPTDVPVDVKPVDETQELKLWLVAVLAGAGAFVGIGLGVARKWNETYYG